MLTLLAARRSMTAAAVKSPAARAGASSVRRPAAVGRASFEHPVVQPLSFAEQLRAAASNGTLKASTVQRIIDDASRRGIAPWERHTLERALNARRMTPEARELLQDLLAVPRPEILFGG